jgi:hypothetical protein
MIHTVGESRFLGLLDDPQADDPTALGMIEKEIEENGARNFTGGTFVSQGVRKGKMRPLAGTSPLLSPRRQGASVFTST